MNDQSGETHTDPDNALGGADVLMVEDPNGTLVVGGEDAVAQFMAQWQGEDNDVMYGRVVTGAERASALSMAADLGATAASVVQYVRLRAAGRGETVVLRRWVTDASGKIVSNARISPAAVGFNPAMMLGIIGLRIALEEASRETVAAVERVEAKTDEVLRLANADRAGDVHGHHRVLRRYVTQLGEGAVLTDTDWSTVAALGPLLEVGVERLRDYATRLVGDLPTGLKADDRAEKLGRVVQEARIGEVLRLLVVAEQSLYLWQRLRIEHVRTSEPQHLGQAADAAHAVLAEHLRADGELVGNLRRVLHDYSQLRPLEFHRKLSGRRLRNNLEALRSDLDYFVTARGLQVESWVPLGSPTTRDAIKVVSNAVIESGKSVRDLGGKVLDGGLAGIGRAGGAVQAKAEQLRGNQQDLASSPEADADRAPDAAADL